MLNLEIILKNFYLILSLSLLSNVCFSQEKTGMAVDPSLNNKAVLFTMTNEQGRTRNLELMEGIFKDGTLGFSAERFHNVSSPFIYSKITEVASNLEEGATLLLYFNSHGGGSGNRFIMTAQGGNFKFSKALEAIKNSNKKIRRLIFLVDTCHAEGSIQDSTGQDGELLKNLKNATPTDTLPELPSQYSTKELPFISVFLNVKKTSRNTYVYDSVIDYGENFDIYDEILIISSSSVEDLSVRGVFASRLASSFNKVKGNRETTVREFLKIFAESHGKSGQQPHYKILPTKKMLEELLFGPLFVQKMPIINYGNEEKFGINYIPIPTKNNL